ncbi:MAG: phosphotransferase [Anaerolineales bacterium]|nr:MAG: phosphotransferase [Anaerolineales bacterium]
MKAYEELTERGKLRRLRLLSLNALGQYNIRVKRVRFLTTETNTMFRVDAGDGQRYVLRIYSAEETTLQDNLAEVFWLDALRNDTDLNVVEPVARRDGKYITTVSIPGVPGKRRCVLFKWVPGRCAGDSPDPEMYYQLGQITAKLHHHASTLILPQGISPKRWDKVFYYPDEPVVYLSESYRHVFSSERVALLATVIERAERLLTDLHQDEAGRMLIHGDLHFWNVHSYRGRLTVIDFEDVMLGYPVQDVAVTFYYGRDREDYRELCAAYQQGYTDLRPWPVVGAGQLETLMAARRVMFINYVARIWPDPEEFIEQSCQRLRRFVETYA